MKWLVPTIIGGVILVIGISFARAQKAAALAAQADAQVATALAAQREANTKSDDALGAPENTANTPGTPTSISDSQTNGPRTVVIFGVQHRDAASLAELLKRMQPKTAGKMYADPRTNGLIFPEGVEQNVLDLLQFLDQPAPKNKVDPDAGADNAAQNGRAVGRKPGLDEQSVSNGPSGLTRLPIIGRMFDPDATSPDTTKSPAAQEYRQYEAQAMALANAYRQQLATSPQDPKRLEQLKSELQGAVHAAFHARQDWQRAQAAQLRTRLEQIERRISERGQSADEIIQRRIEELLHPEKQWEQDVNTAAAVPAGSGPGPMKGWKMQNSSQGKTPRASATDTVDNLAPDTGSTPARSVDPLLGNRTADGLAADEGTRGRREIWADSAGDPRKKLLDAQEEVTAARAKVDEARARSHASSRQLDLQQKAHDAGLVEASVVSALQADTLREMAAVDRAVVQMQNARRREALARETLAAQIKFLEIDLADAKLRMQHADGELARADALHKKGAMTEGQYHESQLAQRLAASQYERAQLLLDLYRKALPGEGAGTDNDSAQNANSN
jgi:type II secretory pathway pseudopilin PulG